MIKILFVCHGNICRSPMAEMIFKSIIRENNLEHKYSCESCATSSEEIGNPIYPPAKSVMRKNGIDFEDHRAVRLQRSDYDKYDLIIGMDKWNIRNIMSIFGADPKSKVKLFKTFGEYSDLDVSDPWYTENFDLCFKEINDLCHCLVGFLESKH